jgi:LPXTG-motif cell wall-anchored protein
VKQEDTTQEIRALLLVTGASMGVAGMVTETSWLVWAGIGVLAVGGVIALIRRWKIKQAERNDTSLED